MIASKIRACGNHVLVRPLPPAENSAGGIFLPIEWRQPSGSGIVLSVGPGRVSAKGVRIEPPLSVGDKVAYSWINGRNEIEVDGQPCVFLDWREINGLLE